MKRGATIRNGAAAALGWAMTSCAILSLTGCGEAKRPGAPSLQTQFEEAKQDPKPDSRARKLIDVAREQKKSYDIGGASESIELAAKACPDIKSPVMRASRFCALAKVQVSLDKKPAARESLKEARAAADLVEDFKERAITLGAIAEVQAIDLDEKKAARATFQAAEDLVRQIEDVNEKGLLQIPIAQEMDKAGMGDEANKLLASMATEAAKIADPRKRSTAISNIAAAQVHLSPPDVAKAAFEQSIKAARSISEEPSKALALIDIAQRVLVSRSKNKQFAAEQVEMGKELLADARPLIDKIANPEDRRQAEIRYTKAESRVPRE